MYKKVIVIYNSYGAFGTSVTNSLEYLQEELIRKKKEVVFIFPEEAKQYEWSTHFANAQFVKYDTTAKSDISPLKDTLISLIKNKEEETIVYLHFVSWRMYAKLKGLNLRMVLHFHNNLNYFKGLKYVAKNILCRFVFRNATCIGVSEDVAENVKNNTSVPANKIFAVQNAIDFRKIASDKRSELISCDDYKIIIMGTYKHAYRKGVDIAGKALELILAEGIKTKLYVVSNNEMPKELLRKTISEEVLSKYVEFIPVTNNIAEYFNACDCMLALSREEGLNMSIVEAAWCGEEIVATKCIGQRCNRTPDISWVSDPTKTPFEQVSVEVKDAIKKLLKDHKKIDFEDLKKKQTIESIYSLDSWGGANYTYSGKCVILA